MSYFGMPVYHAITQDEKLPYSKTECQERWVAEALKTKIEEWVPSSGDSLLPEPILIHAPTGMGKTTFIMEHLVEFAKSQRKWVLILSNRLALNMQFKQILNEKLGLNLGTKILEDISEFGNIKLHTYQSVTPFLLSYKGPKPLFVVCDEAHFFSTDAAFNAWTEEILSNIMFCFPTSCRIYMSATPEDVKPVIAAAECLFWKKQFNNTGNFDFSKYLHRNIKEYHFEGSFKHISLSFFSKWETITDLIESPANSSKWLIFVSSKETGKALKSCLGSDIADYVDSSTKSEDEKKMRELTRRQRFDRKVLICTSVLDNGININDDALKELVIDSTDFVEIIQVIGRKRIKENEKIHIHVCIPGLKAISNFLTANERICKTLQAFDDDPQKFAYQHWGRLNENEQAPFYLLTMRDVGLVIRSNSIATHQLGRRCKKLEELKDAMSLDCDAFAKQICALFGKEFAPDMYEDGKRKKEVIAEITGILSQYEGKPLDLMADLSKIDERLQEFWRQNALSSVKITLKKDRNPRHSEHIIAFIKVFDLPFSLSKKDNFYFLSKNLSN